ncbi:WPP domain-interacting protein 1-like [Andrographis paniculata]|uniref:WPP domain-interacting protein 1-like n=1 Tax=Andrographis paniculata TaxID=175694 RepID=UPI0021E90100|nr:WPP domain-interacting protein 1-like [Andrographis paniculata]XP_051124802.1 WPP domain-interacting protein 1-like [Andrographis paniculata]XP_051124803.1 WPP domain-interacting protein 1-like [Andrographis paniculata]
MDLGSECLVLESLEDNGGITNGSVSDRSNSVSPDSNCYGNGAAAVENGDNNELLLPDGKLKETEVIGSVNSTSSGIKHDQSSLVSKTKKGLGLRKWRRIRRDPNKVGDNSLDLGEMQVTEDLLDSAVNSSKRMLVNSERKQKSQGSFSSTNAVIGRLGSLVPLDDSEFGLGLPFSAGIDSEISEHQSSRSSTAASAPKVKYETGRDKNRIRRSLSGKSYTNSVQSDHQQGKVRIETMKKVRGEHSKIEMENSQSSLESDSRSSKFVFLHETYSASNNRRNPMSKINGGENGDIPQGSRHNINDEHDDEGVVADSSWNVSQNLSFSSRGLDTLVDSIFTLQSAQDALEREVLKFKDVGKDISADDYVSGLHTEFTPNGFPRVEQFNVIVEASEDISADLEDLFKQKIEAEVEYLVISTTVQKLKAAQITILEEQKQMLGNTEKNAEMLRNEAEKLENVCENISRADEILHLQKTIWKHSSCFFIQLVALVVIFAIFIQRIAQNHHHHAAPLPT